jgi:hypothetical protein
MVRDVLSDAWACERDTRGLGVAEDNGKGRMVCG